MSGKNGKARRRRSAQEKVRILEEARAPNTTVAEVLRQHQLDAATPRVSRCHPVESVPFSAGVDTPE